MKGDKSERTVSIPVLQDINLSLTAAQRENFRKL